MWGAKLDANDDIVKLLKHNIYLILNLFCKNLSTKYCQGTKQLKIFELFLGPKNTPGLGDTKNISADTAY